MLPPDISRAVDGLMKADLQHWRDRWFSWLLYSAGAVAVGVLLEGPELLYEIIGLVRRKDCELTLDERHKAPGWVPLVALVGWILVVAGVAGEVVTESFVSQADGNLQTFNDVVVAEAQKESAAALARAASAYQQAVLAEINLAHAEQQAAEAKSNAETERLARVQLERDLQPRRLTTAQKEKLTSLLRDRPLPIGIMWAMDGTEAVDFANDIGDALNKAGWITVFGIRSTLEHGIEVGTMKGSDLSILMPEIERLKRSLSEVGFSSRTTMLDPQDNQSVLKPQKNGLYLLIDHKPERKSPP